MYNETSSVDSSSTLQPQQQAPTRVAPSNDGELTSSRQDPGDIGPMERERSSSVSDEYLRFLSQPGNVEKKFPVDRKKLERLIIAGRNDKETAADFFQNVMDSSSTLILWPSKLKIGAKSKKDPQVKVVGLPANVQKARELILADLDAKSEKVTLKIDVPFSEHSHVIGKEGANIKKVHEETKCHIHFPDSNRSLHTDKSNQVSITGQEKGVELGRKRIRELLPVVVTFTLPLPGHIDPNSPDIQQMMLQYNVSIHIKPQPRHFSMLLVVRGTVRFQDGMKLAINKLVEYFTGDFRSLPQVMLNQDLAAQHHRTIIGSGGGNIRKIMEDSGTTIQFPDPQSRYQSNQVTITGSVDGVFRAREQLLGCLPVVLMFDVHDTEDSGLGTDRQTALVGDLMQRWDVYISIKAKKQPIQSVIIKSIEQNMTCVYEARRRILEFCSHSSAHMLPDSTQIGVANGKMPGELESSCESSLTGSLSEAAQQASNRSVQIPMSFSEDRITSKASFTSSGTYTTATGGGGGGGWEEGEKAGESGSGLLPPEITVDESGGLHSPTPEASDDQPVVVSPSLSLQPPRLTTRCFIDYDRKKEEAEKAKTSKIETTEPRRPTHYWSGYNFSESWAPGEGGASSTTGTQMKTPQGLSSLNKSGFQALKRQASLERAQSLQSEQEIYRGVSDLATLLRRLDMEKYQSCFDDEEIDLQVLLHMNEGELDSIGIKRLGPRRKLMLAISELKKIQASTRQSGGGTSTIPPLGMGGLGSSATAAVGGYQKSLGPLPGGLGKSSSLKRATNYSMSHSVKF